MSEQPERVYDLTSMTVCAVKMFYFHVEPSIAVVCTWTELLVPFAVNCTLPCKKWELCPDISCQDFTFARGTRYKLLLSQNKTYTNTSSVSPPQYLSYSPLLGIIVSKSKVKLNRIQHNLVCKPVLFPQLSNWFLTSVWFLMSFAKISPLLRFLFQFDVELVINSKFPAEHAKCWTWICCGEITNHHLRPHGVVLCQEENALIFRSLY